jgi:hypothetical protein
MREPTRKEIKKAWKKAAKQFNFKIVYSKSFISKIIYNRIACKALQKQITNNAKKFLNNRFVTACLNSDSKYRYVFIPYKLCSKKMTAVEWLETLAHELTHIDQINKYGTTGFYLDYFTSKTNRAMYEAEAETAGSCDIRRAINNLSCRNPALIFDTEWMKLYNVKNKHRISAINYYTSLTNRIKKDPCQYSGFWTIKTIKKIMKES